MNYPLIGLGAFAALVNSASAFAHGGHGVTPLSGLSHLLVEPVHVLGTFAPLAVVAAVVWVLRRRAIRS